MRQGVLALVAVTLLAGCGGFVGAAPDGTVTPAPVPEPTATEATGSAIAPGVGGAQVTDADRLARAHREAMRNRSYVWHQRQSASPLDGNRSQTIHTRLRVEHERRYRYDLATSWRPANTSGYTEGDTRYRREVSRAGYTYTRNPATDVTVRYGDQPVQAISRYLSIGSARVAATTVDGDRYYRITGTTDAIPVTGEISNYSVQALVAPTGFVRSLSVSYDDVIGSDRERIDYSFRYSAVGETTVEPPAWVQARWPENVTTATPTATATKTATDAPG
jgi:hypothetical protein